MKYYKAAFYELRLSEKTALFDWSAGIIACMSVASTRKSFENLQRKFTLKLDVTIG